MGRQVLRTPPQASAVEAGETGPPPRLPRAVWAIAGVVVLLLLAVANRYGWHRDELYFLEAGHHLGWGYVDQPPFTPFVARLADELAHHNLVVLRLVPALATAVTVAIGASLTRELGGTGRAPILAAGALAGGGYVLGAGHLLATATFDLTAWMALLWVAVRLLRTGDVRWWAAFGAIAGAALLNKHLVVLLVVALLAGLALERRWDLLATRWLVLGGVLALAIAAPNLLWQAANGWPQLDMADALSDRLATENRVTLLPLQLLFLGPLLVPLLWWGAGWLRRHPSARPYRPLLWAWPIGIAITFASGGRPYYTFPLTLVVALAGVVAHVQRSPRSTTLPWLVVLNAALVIPAALPVLPVRTAVPAVALNETIAETIGWPELVNQVADVVAGLPPEDQADVVLLAATYGEAGALDRFGGARGLPPPFSPHNHYAEFRRPRNDDATVVAVRYSADDLAPHFRECRRVASVEVPHDVPNEVNGAPIVVCQGLEGTWDDVWPRLRFLS